MRTSVPTIVKGLSCSNNDAVSAISLVRATVSREAPIFEIVGAAGLTCSVATM